MARWKFQGTTKDQSGRILPSATISVYLAGTTTSASVYTSVTSTTAVNSVTSSSTDATYAFYTDSFDYDHDQAFKIIITKPSYTSVTYDNLPHGEVVLGTYTISTAKTVTTYVKVPKGVVYAKSGSGSLTFNGGFEAGPYQIFSGFDVGDVIFNTIWLSHMYPQWWGAKGTGDGADAVTNYQAFTSAIESMGGGDGATEVSTGYTLLVPQGSYFFSQEVRITRSMTLKGEGGGIGTRIGPELVFPAGSNGLVVIRHSGGTGGDGTGTPTNPDHYSLGASIENFKVRAIGKTTKVAGIALTSLALIRNVAVYNFGGYGIYIQSAIPDIGSKLWRDPQGSELIAGIAPSELGGAGNKGGANGWYIDNALLVSNTYSGLHIVGGDSNNGVAIMVVAQASLVGVSDQSSIGNTYIGFLPEVNTDAAFQASSDAGTVTFIGCNFSEGNGPNNIASDGTLFVGCIGVENYKTFRAAGSFVLTPSLYNRNTGGTDVVQTTLWRPGVNSSILTMQTELPSEAVDASTETALHWNSSDRVWEFWNVNSIPIFYLFPYYSAESLWSQGFAGAPRGIGIGGGGWLKLTAATVAHATGTHELGDRVLNSAPSVGQPKAWACTVAGTQGTLNSGATTGSITIGTPTLVANTATGIYIGQYLAVAGAVVKQKVLSVVGTTITLNGNATATVTGAAVSFVNATWVSEGNL